MQGEFLSTIFFTQRSLLLLVLSEQGCKHGRFSRIYCL